MSTATTTTTSATAGLFEKLAGNAEARRQRAEAAYRKLALQLADGAKVTPEQAEAVILDADKTADDLRADVERVTLRRQAVAALQDAEAAAAEREGAEASLAGLGERLLADLAAAEAKLRSDHARATAPWHAKLARCRDRVSAGYSARRQLEETAGPEYRRLLDEAAALERQARDALADVADEARELREAIEKCSRNLSVYQQRAANSRPGAYDTDITSCSRALANYHERLEGINSAAEARAAGLKAEAAEAKAASEELVMRVD